MVSSLDVSSKSFLWLLLSSYSPYFDDKILEKSHFPIAVQKYVDHKNHVSFSEVLLVRALAPSGLVDPEEQRVAMEKSPIDTLIFPLKAHWNSGFPVAIFEYRRWEFLGFSTYWCVLRREWMGCWGLLGLLLVSQWIIPENSLRWAPVNWFWYWTVDASHFCRSIRIYTAYPHLWVLSHMFLYWNTLFDGT